MLAQGTWIGPIQLNRPCTSSASGAKAIVFTLSISRSTDHL
jgi:hypothetical protein